MATPPPLEQLVREHCTLLHQLCCRMSSDPSLIELPLVQDMRMSIDKLAQQQVDKLEQDVKQLEQQLEDKWKRVNDWRTALGEQHVGSARTSTGGTTKRGSDADIKLNDSLDVQLTKVDTVLDGMRSRMQQRGQTIVELHKRIETQFVPILGLEFLNLQLEDVQQGWERLDLRLERMSSLEREILRCEAELAHRRDVLNAHVNEIFALRAELGISQPADVDETQEATSSNGNDDFDEVILCHLGVGDHRQRKEMPATKENLARLDAKRKWVGPVHNRVPLEQEKETRNHTIQATYDKLYPLWTMLGVSEVEMEQFVNCWMGSTMDVVNAYQSELQRMLSLKRTNMSAFIVRERQTLNQLWDQLFLSEPQRVASFPPYSINVDPSVVWNPETGCEEEIVNDNVNEELLVAHEREREKVEQEVERALPVLEKLAKYFNVVEEGRQLEASANDPSRLLGKSTRGDPGRLLREEKARKRVAKEKPRLEQELRVVIPEWEQLNQRPFLVNGTRFLDELDMKIEAELAEKENKKRAKAGPTARAATTTAPLRPQMTGQQPLKRQMTGRTAATPVAKRQAPMPTGSIASSNRRVLGDHNGTTTALRSQHTGASTLGYGGAGVTSHAKVTPQMTGRSAALNASTGSSTSSTTGMRIPAGWAGTSSSTTKSQTMAGLSFGGVQSQPATAGFRPRPSVVGIGGGNVNLFGAR
ncbi:Microtubule bundling protein [Microbotryomycetes sp. JL221]|nr:Microtubule bundling protein [Microbotryomycetes sp. JL221]